MGDHSTIICGLATDLESVMYLQGLQSLVSTLQHCLNSTTIILLFSRHTHSHILVESVTMGTWC